MGPPAERLYAVEPVGVDTIIPSALNVSNIRHLPLQKFYHSGTNRLVIQTSFKAKLIS